MHPITVDTQVVSVAAGVFIPLVVGLLTKTKAPRDVKAVTNAGLAAIAAVANAIVQANGTFLWRSAIVSFGVIWVTSIATHYGLWKPTGVSDVVNAVLPQFGIGGEVEPEVTQPVQFAINPALVTQIVREEAGKLTGQAVAGLAAGSVVPSIQQLQTDLQTLSTQVSSLVAGLPTLVASFSQQSTNSATPTVVNVAGVPVTPTPPEPSAA